MNRNFVHTQHVPYFLPLSRATRVAMARPGGTTRPKATARLQQAALNQMPRCTADECASILPGQFSFGPDFDAELPAVPAPQRVMLHPHHSCTYRPASRELLAYPWWPCASTRTVKPQERNQKPHDRADSPHCVCRHGATVCMHLWAGIASMSASVAASQAPGSQAQLI